MGNLGNSFSGNPRNPDDFSLPGYPWQQHPRSLYDPAATPYAPYTAHTPFARYPNPMQHPTQTQPPQPSYPPVSSDNDLRFLVGPLDAAGALDLRDAEAIWLAQSYGVVAEEIDRRRAPSASGDRLYLARVLAGWSPAIPPTAAADPYGRFAPYAVPGRKWVVRIWRYNARHLTCACSLGKRQGDACGHIGAVLLLLRG